MARRITVAVLLLGTSAEFKRTLNYRGDWVHDQPPRVTGLGITYGRGVERWKPVLNEHGTRIGIGLNVCGGDPTRGSIEKIVDDALLAVQSLTVAATGVLEAYDAAVADCGIRVDRVAGKLELRIFDGT